MSEALLVRHDKAVATLYLNRPELHNAFDAGLISTLTAALEYLAALDVRAEQPLRSALVISQGASRLPRPGFFECAGRLGRFHGDPDGVAAAAWHAAEVVRVFEHDFQRGEE